MQIFIVKSFFYVFILINYDDVCARYSTCTSGGLKKNKKNMF